MPMKRANALEGVAAIFTLPLPETELSTRPHVVKQRGERLPDSLVDNMQAVSVNTGTTFCLIQLLSRSTHTTPIPKSCDVM